MSGIALDRDGRIYAATSVGVQVFDPTGRLCGVLPLPKAGTVRGLEWRETPTRGLALVLDGTVFVREMK